MEDSDIGSDGSDGSDGPDGSDGSDAIDAVDPDTQRDTQRPLATLMLQEQEKGDKSGWAPFLAMLTPAHTPPIWSVAAARFLDGTELAPVLAQKRLRMVAERDAREELRCYTHAQYAAACALAASHANPYFGVSVVPFNTQLNWSAQPNAEFALERVDTQLASLAPSVLAPVAGTRCVVGRALRSIEAGVELTQAYDESTAMLVYQYGFAPTAAELEWAGASNAWGEECAVSISLETLARACGCGHAALTAAVAPLRAAGALGACPWGGLGHIVTVELQRGGMGTAKLFGVCLMLLLDSEQAVPVAAAVATASGTGVGLPEDADQEDLAAAAL
eukprot:g8291.t1